MEADLGALASSAATTIVNLLATDAWDQVKAKVGTLWRPFKPEQADVVAVDLERTRQEIQDADATVALALTREWESRLLRLLATDAAVATELKRVVSELLTIPTGQPNRSDVWQRARASGRSTVIQVAGDGNIGELP